MVRPRSKCAAGPFSVREHRKGVCKCLYVKRAAAKMARKKMNDGRLLATTATCTIGNISI